MAIVQRWKGVRALPEDLEARLDALPAWLARHGVELAYLFGSAARKPAEAHDLDLAVLRSDGPVYELREELWDRLGSPRLEELDVILEELAKHRGTDPEAYARDLGLQWKVERGLLAAAGVVFDVADHILAGHFGEQAETYEESLSLLRDREVMSPSLYERTKGLGGFRSVLVHRYLEIDPDEVLLHLDRAFDVLPAFAREVMDWLDEAPDEEL